MSPEKAITDFLATFDPVSIGDPVGNLGPSILNPDAGVRYFPLNTWWHWGLTALILFGIIACLFNFKWRKNATRRKRIVSVAVWTILPALIVAGTGFAASFYWGGPYAYENYRVPPAGSDVIIWFSGSDDGAYFQDNIARCLKQYPLSMKHRCFRAALFNFSDMDLALDYVRKFPEGCRVVVRGHSMGGATAMRFAQQCDYPIELLDTRDPTSWTGQRPTKPDSVKFWRNVLPEKTGLHISEQNHIGTNYILGVNMANLFRILGGPWNECPDALNIRIPDLDHREVGENID